MSVLLLATRFIQDLVCNAILIGCFYGIVFLFWSMRFKSRVDIWFQLNRRALFKRLSIIKKFPFKGLSVKTRGMIAIDWAQTDCSLFFFFPPLPLQARLSTFWWHPEQILLLEALIIQHLTGARLLRTSIWMDWYCVNRFLSYQCRQQDGTSECSHHLSPEKYRYMDNRLVLFPYGVFHIAVARLWQFCT